MNGLLVLVPVALLLGLSGLAAFFWALRNHQFDDPDGSAARILIDDEDDEDDDEEQARDRRAPQD